LQDGYAGDGGNNESVANIIKQLRIMQSTFKDLIAKTNLFFKLHWPENNEPNIPKWSEPWDYNSSIPYGDKPGCYAFIDNNNQIVYIGVGASKGKGIYGDAGIGKRVGRYKRLNKSPDTNTKYELKEPWNNRNIKELRTIGFPPKYGYLTYSLEVFLIRNLQPVKYNSTNRVL